MSINLQKENHCALYQPPDYYIIGIANKCQLKYKCQRMEETHLEKFYDKVIKRRRLILMIFLVLTVLMLICKSFVSVNYDMNSYLPENSASTVALDVMGEEFDGGIPNARVMVYDVSIAEALEYKEKLSEIDGVTEVQWLDDTVSMTQPIELADSDTVETYYKDNNALFTVTIEENSIIRVVSDIRNLIGNENAMTGSAVSTAIATESTMSEVQKIAVIAVLFVFFILVVTTTSWIEPIIVLLGLGVAVLLNAGSNLIFGEISFVTNAAGNILQLAVSLDYSVFLIHRFEECRQKETNPEIAMREALIKSTSSIISSGLTTVIGFLALVLMRFRIGPDLGLALAKGIAISLLTVFLFMPGLILMTYRLLEKTKHRSLMPNFHIFGKIVSKMMLPLAVVFAIMIVPAYLSSVSNSYYYGSSHIFAAGTQLGDDTAAIQNIFGENDTYVLLIPKGDTATEKVLSDELKELENVTSIISYVDKAGAMIPYEYLDEDTLSLLESEHYSRMVLSVNVAYEGDETTALIDEIKNTAEKYYPGTYYLAGEGVSTYDLQETVTADMVKVNLVAIGAVFLVLLFTIKSVLLPLILVLTIETAVWINLSFPYYMDSSLFYIAYLIISSIQLGATVDYAILFTDRYKENRKIMDKKQSVICTVSNVTTSILTSGLTLAVVGTLLGVISTHGLLSQLGYLLGRGSVCSMIAVLLILPGFLYLFDRTFMEKKGALTMKKKIGKKGIGKRVTAGVLAGLMIFTGSVNTAQAAEAASEKEEIVYAMLDADGTVTGVYVVNVFSGGDIVDYGDYTNVRNMTTTDEIQMENDVVRFSTDADKVYYQGNLDSTDIPWKIEIHYYMDNQEYSPEEIAGMSGALKISISISQNAACDESFWEGYALQATVLLDAEMCKNLEAEGATIANVTSDKQLSYIILPGKGKEIEITADVTEFEMDTISINGVRLNLNMDYDDSELQEKVQEIQDAIGELNDGASELSDSTGSLDDGVQKLNDGMETIQEALNTLNGESSSLISGSAQILAALEMIQTSLSSISVNSEDLSALANASTQIKEGISSLVAGLQTMDGSIASYYQTLSDAGLSSAGALASQNAQAISSLGITDTQRALYSAYVQGSTEGAISKLAELVQAGDSEAVNLYQKYIDASGTLSGNTTADAGVITEYITNAGKFISIETLLNADTAYISGSDQLISGIDAALDSESGALMTGAMTLQSSYTEFDSTIQTLVTVLGSLVENMGSLKNGIDTIVTNYETLDSGINSYTEAVASILDGYHTLYEGSLELAEGSGELYSGTLDLYDGTSTFQSETSDMDTQISDAISDTIDTMTGKDVETVSFVSEKNTNVDSVLFVIKTQAIEIPETVEKIEVTEKEQSFWQKFLNIFGI